MNRILFKTLLFPKVLADLPQKLKQKQEHKGRFCCFCSGLDVTMFFQWDAVQHRSQLSHGAIFNPSSPVICPDGCKAALLQNMSRAGEEEVGVESGKGQRPKTSSSTSSCSHMLWHRSHAAGTLKQVVKPPPTKRTNLFWNVFVYF